MIQLTSHDLNADMVDEDELMEPLSPELALVDPELARVARDRLPPLGETPSSAGRRSDKDFKQTSVEHSWFPDPDQGRRPENSLSDTSGFASEARSVPDSVLKERQLRAASRPRRRVRVVLGALGVIFAAIAAYALIPDSAVREQARNRAPSKTSDASARTVPRAPSKTSDANARTVPRRSGVLGARGQRSTKAARTRPFPNRVLIWPAVSDATSYKVELFRNGREVFETLSSRARFELPTRWVYRRRTYHLEKGTYIWKVLPAFGPRSRLRYGNPIVRSTYVAER